MVKAHDVVDKLKYSAHIATEYWPARWEESTFILEGRHELLDLCARYFPKLISHIEEYHSYTFKSAVDDDDEEGGRLQQVKQISSVLCGSDFR